MPPRFANLFARKASALLFALGLAASLARGVTMEELLGDSKMTPKRFAAYFEDFRFQRDAFDVINPRQFLARKAGDCIDYAVLADHVLSHHGYKTRLVRVEMIGKNVGHAVCYVDDDRVYLDYNNRKYFFTLTKSGRRLRDIATKVADSLKANWTFAQEFTFDYDSYQKRAVYTVVKTDPPESDPDHQASRN
ncbi:MAG: hypothetical protein H7A44_04660 [Opitutaceae bacterium]|nr:hypothetical protein [Cephaloticoccus sp.]MCP5529714.1 hypothetical protein [Opitutaceae bacterium]